MKAIGVDIGGMTIKVGLVDENGKIIGENRVKTAKTADVCIDNLFLQIRTLLNQNNLTEKDIRGIGIGCPGLVDVEKGVVEHLPNLGWVNVPLVALLKEKFRTEIRISNDANVATLGEVLFGAAKGYDSAVMFTLGTGVGGGIVINGKLYEGGKGRGAELGHTTLIMNGAPCTCGRNGCVEAYASATALIGQTKAAMCADGDSEMWKYVGGNIDAVDGRTAFECEKKGDPAAKRVVDNYVTYLSEAIMNMLNIFRPPVFILGGGISKEGKNLTERVTAYLEEFSYGYKFAPKTEIVTATLGNDAGIIGAAALV